MDTPRGSTGGAQRCALTINTIVVFADCKTVRALRPATRARPDRVPLTSDQSAPTSYLLLLMLLLLLLLLLLTCATTTTTVLLHVYIRIYILYIHTYKLCIFVYTYTKFISLYIQYVYTYSNIYIYIYQYRIEDIVDQQYTDQRRGSCSRCARATSRVSAALLMKEVIDVCTDITKLIQSTSPPKEMQFKLLIRSYYKLLYLKIIKPRMC